MDQYDLPLKPEAYERAERTAGKIVSRFRRRLWTLSAVTTVAGLVVSWWTGNFDWFGRSGALLTALSIGHAYTALRWAKMSETIVDPTVVKMFTIVELDKMAEAGVEESPEAMELARATALKRVSRVAPKTYKAVQRRFVADHLLVGLVGTLVWGFGDLLPWTWRWLQ